MPCAVVVEQQLDKTEAELSHAVKERDKMAHQLDNFRLQVGGSTEIVACRHARSLIEFLQVAGELEENGAERESDGDGDSGTKNSDHNTLRKELRSGELRRREMCDFLRAHAQLKRR